MPRKGRVLSNDGIYHIMLRAVNRQRIFEEDADYKLFLNIIQDYKISCGFRLYAYCFMDNHIHLLLKTGPMDLGKIMLRITSKFVYWYNIKYQRSGHLFQGRYKSEPVEGRDHFMTVLRYIHQNPVKAGICISPEEYPYSSYRDYLYRNNDWVDISQAFEIMEDDSFFIYSIQENEDCCMDDTVRPYRHYTDEQAQRIYVKCCDGISVWDFQRLGMSIRNTYLRKLKKAGLSVRQIRRLTGISLGVIQRAQ